MDTIQQKLRAPRKKALLIGINYDNAGVTDYKLSGPHHDVLEMKKLLVSVYQFKEKDIVVMRDGVGYKKKQPKRANIIREVCNLVKDAAPGDQLFLHFSGHSTQVENRTGSESDGRDEALIPIDDKDGKKVILDNELRRCLVDHLPAGSKLVALFDTCHSCSILDLEHYRCNRVYVPWINKGNRDPDPIRNSIVRRGDIDYVRKSTVDPIRKRSTQETKLSLHSLDTECHKFFQCDGQSSTQQQHLLLHDSPISRYCDGWCAHHRRPAQEKAEVLCFSAAKDRQVSWENEGESMTMAFIRVLEKNPNPSLKELMTLISHSIHHISLMLHEAARQKRILEMQADPDPSLKDWPELEMDNFQNPQLSSHQPLNMEAIFSL